eukprot:TRINITY_DN6578_c0_g1_i1.p2 TRINITY_DN6578_c0_g1~~TRINITY_DN6578_c0_g1_i1.p2  ORF type:complete len:132 (+),score=53.47 TRINITY_DN6578_c0_g1_i1:45-398(+)
MSGRPSRAVKRQTSYAEMLGSDSEEEQPTVPIEAAAAADESDEFDANAVGDDEEEEDEVIEEPTKKQKTQEKDEEKPLETADAAVADVAAVPVAADVPASEPVEENKTNFSYQQAIY